MPFLGPAPRLVVRASLLVVVLVLGLSASVSAAPRILAGSLVPITNHPYQVQVTSGGFACGGSIRDATHVITAAHCVVNEESFFPFIVSPTRVDVGYGDADQTQLDVVGVAQISVYPAYLRNQRSSEFDVAVLTLNGAINLSGATAKAIPFASNAEFTNAYSSGVPGFVTGWGNTAEGGADSRFLRGVSLTLRGDGPCIAEYRAVSQGGDYNRDVMICAGGEGTLGSGNPDTCQGDSGGPLAIDTSSTGATVYKLVGIVSFGNGCGRRGVPGVYARVQSPTLRPFLEDLTPGVPPSAPASNPTIGGTPRVGAALTCNAPPLAGARVAAYTWSVFDPTDSSFTAVAVRQGPSFTLPVATLGARLVCDARYENDGGFSYSDSDSTGAVGPVLPALPVAPTVPTDTTRPRARIGAISCRRGKCTIKVRASDVGGQVRSLSARLTYTGRRCRTVSGRRRCTSVKKAKRLRPRKTTAGFTIVTRLKPARYTLTAVATDTSSNRSSTARKTFRVRRR